MKLIVRIILFISLISCTAHMDPEQIDELTPGVANAIAKAHTLSQITWVPITPLEYNNGLVYPAGAPIQGVPYSSVKEIQTYIGLDVSVYTFLTATMNPYSLLYTEKIDQEPYRGTNCRMYYGVVCSSAVMYTLGLPIPYSTKLFTDTDLFVKCEKQSPEDIFLCSVLLQPGHMTMVVGIGRDDFGNIISVDIFESMPLGTSIYTLTFDQFCERWKNNDIVQYEYKYIEDNTEVVSFESDCEVLSNDIFIKQFDICPNKGDKSSYTSEEDVIINILTSSAYISAELYMNGSLFDIRQVDSGVGKQIIYSDLLPGEYTVRLCNGQAYSDWSYFEVLDVSTDISFNGDVVELRFNSSNAIPDFVSYNSITSGAARQIFNPPGEVAEFTIPYSSDYIGKSSIRVTYKGKYGRVFYQYNL